MTTAWPRMAAQRSRTSQDRLMRCTAEASSPAFTRAIVRQMQRAHGQPGAVPGEGARADVALLDVSAAWDAGGALRDAARRELPIEVRRAAVAGLGAACVAGASVIAAYLVVFGLATAHGGAAVAALQRVKALVAAGALCAG